MLAISRKPDESFIISPSDNPDDDIIVTVVKVQGKKIRLGIDAPDTTQIVRSEIKDKEYYVIRDGEEIVLEGHVKDEYSIPELEEWETLTIYKTKQEYFEEN